MKRSISAASLSVLIFAAAPGAAQVYVPGFAGDFSSFANGDLAGQNGWTPITITPTGLQVVSGKVVTAGGQTVDPPDARFAFSAAVPATVGTTFYFGLTLRVTQLPTSIPTGSDIVSATTAAGQFGPRLAFNRLSGNNQAYLFSMSGGTPQPPSQSIIYLFDDLNPHFVGENLRVILAYDFLSGTNNDHMALYVDPTSPIRNNNTPAFEFQNSVGLGWADLSNLLALNLSVGQSAPTSELGRITAAGSFGEVYSFISVPEPSSLLFAALGMAAVGWIRRATVPKKTSLR